jgi:hypothetical protein
MLEYDRVSNNFKGDITVHVEEKKRILVLSLNRYHMRREADEEMSNLI